MDQNILNKLEIGEKIVEMQECILHEQTVIKVTIYKCVSDTILLFFKNNKIDTYEFPFYFSSKEFAEEFLQNFDKYKIELNSYWNNEAIACYIIKIANHYSQNKYYLVDDFKNLHADKFDNMCYVEKRGVWGGIVNTNGEFHTYDFRNINYKDIFKYENIAEETDKKYIFKMVEQ